MKSLKKGFKEATNQDRFNQYYDYIQAYRLFDSTFMNVVFEDLACLKLLVETVFDLDDAELDEQSIQKNVIYLPGDVQRHDILVKDKKLGYITFDILKSKAEINGLTWLGYMNLVNRLLDSDKDVEDVYIVYIMENDLLNEGFPIYHIDYKIAETEIPFKDGSNFMYVNGAKHEDTKLGRLMHDFNCVDPDDMYNPVLANRVRYLKREDEGLKKMCEILEELNKDVA